ncbi:hypothetical protein R6Q57_019782 [Mikania cordata]
MVEMVEIDHLMESHTDSLRVVSLEYFDLQSLRNTDQWEGIRLGIYAGCQRLYKDRKQEFKKHFDKVGGYEDVEKAKRKPPNEMDQQAWEQLIDQFFFSSDFKKRDDARKFKRFTHDSGDSSSVNQIECMECVLGQRRGHIRGVGRVVRHFTPDVSSIYPSTEGQWQNKLDEQGEQLQQ